MGEAMNQEERRNYLIRCLLKEREDGERIDIPKDPEGQRRLLRALMNVRPPKEIGEDFLEVQDEYLTEEARRKGVVTLDAMEQMEDGIYLWQGDITRLGVGAIVNAANSGMTGCYVPNHNCIDNCIHTFSGVQLRLDCERLMEEQGHEEPTGQAKITHAYNLPCEKILHTVGPIITGEVTPRDEELLASCYRSCLQLADQKGLSSIAFCCISTGVFHFPNDRAAEIAVDTAKEYKKKTESDIQVVFNVFKDEDHDIYRKLLGRA